MSDMRPSFEDEVKWQLDYVRKYPGCIYPSYASQSVIDAVEFLVDTGKIEVKTPNYFRRLYPVETD